MRNRLVQGLVRLAFQEGKIAALESQTLPGRAVPALASVCTTLNSVAQTKSKAIGPFAGSSARGYSSGTASNWDSVLYPESELEVGELAPDFSLEGMSYDFVLGVKSMHMMRHTGTFDRCCSHCEWRDQNSKLVRLPGT